MQGTVVPAGAMGDPANRHFVRRSKAGIATMLRTQHHTSHRQEHQQELGLCPSNAACARDQQDSTLRSGAGVQDYEQQVQWQVQEQIMIFADVWTVWLSLGSSSSLPRKATAKWCSLPSPDQNHSCCLDVAAHACRADQSHITSLIYVHTYSNHCLTSTSELAPHCQGRLMQEEQ